MKCVKEVLDVSMKTLEERGFSNARRLAEGMLTYVLGLSRLDLYMSFDRPLEATEVDRCRAYFKRLCIHEPPAYIEGGWDFFGRHFKVTTDVLIPRAETELLVEGVLKVVKRSQVVWDVCTGSGCIGITLKSECPDLDLTLSDISEKALDVAKINAQALGAEVSFLQGDLLVPFSGQKADIIVCNPPYIAESEYQDLEPSVKNFEPHLALVANDDGLACYKHLAKVLKEFLNPKGHLFLEMGFAQFEDVKRIFEQQGFTKTSLIKDLEGHQRHFIVENE